MHAIFVAKKKKEYTYMYVHLAKLKKMQICLKLRMTFWRWRKWQARTHKFLNHIIKKHDNVLKTKEMTG